jgi:hypothetical protein
MVYSIAKEPGAKGSKPALKPVLLSDPIRRADSWTGRKIYSKIKAVLPVYNTDFSVIFYPFWFYPLLFD